LKFGVANKKVYSDLTTDDPIDLSPYQVACCYMGRSGLINSRGGSGQNDLQRHIRTQAITEPFDISTTLSWSAIYSSPDLLNARNSLIYNARMTSISGQARSGRFLANPDAGEVPCWSKTILRSGECHKQSRQSRLGQLSGGLRWKGVPHFGLISLVIAISPVAALAGTHEISRIAEDAEYALIRLSELILVTLLLIRVVSTEAKKQIRQLIHHTDTGRRQAGSRRSITLLLTGIIIGIAATALAVMILEP
jgi:hypothetical protein